MTHERLWPIDEYHKAWKSGGTQVAIRYVQTRDNLERMIAILSFNDVRVLALWQGGLSEERFNANCELVLSFLEWKLLWGWLKLQDIAEGHKLAKSLDREV